MTALADKFLQFLGASSSSKDLDDFLSEIGIRARPKKNEATVFISHPDKTINLDFQAYEFYCEESLSPPLDEGKFILQKIELSKNNPVGLPLGLDPGITVERANELFGTAREDDIVGGNRVLIYLHNGLIFTFFFNIRDMSFNCMSASKPDIYEKQRGIVD